MEDTEVAIEEAEKAIDEDRFDDAREILKPLVAANIPAAVRLNASFFEENVSEEEAERRYVEGMFLAAELGDAKARYQILLRRRRDHLEKPPRKSPHHLATGLHPGQPSVPVPSGLGAL